MQDQAQRVLSLLQVIFDRRQAPQVPVQEPVQFAADEILKFRQLLDAGVITKEEFTAKKKELLGL